MSSSPRYWNIALGIWLFISAFAWRHGSAQFANTWICGLLCIGFAMAGLQYARARYLNTALGIWLFISAWMLPTLSVGTVWNNVLVGVAIFFVSLVPGDARGRRGDVPRRTKSPRAVRSSDRDMRH